MQNAKCRMLNGKKTIALFVLSAIVLLSACGGDSPTQVPPTDLPPTLQASATAVAQLPTVVAGATDICAPGNAPAFLKEVVLAKDTEGANFTPVDVTETFEPSQATFHAIVTLKGAPANLQLGTKWYLVQASGYTPNNKIDEKMVTVEQGGSRNVDFTLKSAQATWPPGTYCVEIYADGNLALSKVFSVVGGSAPSNADAHVVKQIVLAEDAQPVTFEPINPTGIFAANASAIHMTVQIKDAPANSEFMALWYPPNQDPLKFELPPVGGTRWLDFRLTPPPDGFPNGEYKVEIYLNDELVDTKTFSVK